MLTLRRSLLLLGSTLTLALSPLALALAQAANSSATAKPQVHNRHLTDSGDTIEVGVQPRYLLQNQYGAVITNQDFPDQFQLITFGYTSCPDVCPTTLAEMAAILEQLGDAGKRVQPLFITVDPARDTPKVLGNYVAFFHPRIQGLTGSQPLVQRVAENFKVRFEKVREPGSDQYWMDHSAGMYLLGPDGAFIAKFAYAMPAAEITERLRQFIAEAPPPRQRKGGEGLEGVPLPAPAQLPQ